MRKYRVVIQSEQADGSMAEVASFDRLLPEGMGARLMKALTDECRKIEDEAGINQQPEPGDPPA